MRLRVPARWPTGDQTPPPTPQTFISSEGQDPPGIIEPVVKLFELAHQGCHMFPHNRGCGATPQVCLAKANPQCVFCQTPPAAALAPSMPATPAEDDGADALNMGKPPPDIAEADELNIGKPPPEIGSPSPPAVIAVAPLGSPPAGIAVAVKSK